MCAPWHRFCRFPFCKEDKQPSRRFLHLRGGNKSIRRFLDSDQLKNEQKDPTFPPSKVGFRDVKLWSVRLSRVIIRAAAPLTNRLFLHAWIGCQSSSLILSRRSSVKLLGGWTVMAKRMQLMKSQVLKVVLRFLQRVLLGKPPKLQWVWTYIHLLRLIWFEILMSVLGAKMV